MNYSTKKLANPELTFPSFSEDQVDKLKKMWTLAQTCHGKKLSELSKYEKQVVEFFFKRVAVDNTGRLIATKNISTLPEDQVFSRLAVNQWAISYMICVIKEHVSCPAPQTLFVLEDEVLNPDDLYGDAYKYSGDPFMDGLNSWPDNYLPVRNSKGKAVIKAVWKSGSGPYLYKDRAQSGGVIKNEHLYKNPLLTEPEVKLTKAQVTESKVIYEANVIAIVKAIAELGTRIDRSLEIPTNLDNIWKKSHQYRDTLKNMGDSLSLEKLVLTILNNAPEKVIRGTTTFEDESTKVNKVAIPTPGTIDYDPEKFTGSYLACYITNAMNGVYLKSPK